MKYFFTVVLLVIFSGALIAKDAIKMHSNIKFVKEKSQIQLEQKPYFSQKTLNSFKNAKTLADILKIDHFVKLETTENSILASIKDIVFLDNCYFILDDKQNKIYKFSETGKFIKIIGNIGQGPGEYQIPFHIEKCYGNNLAVLDAGVAKIIVYSSDGNLIRTIKLRIVNSVFGHNKFIFNQENKIYLHNFMTLNYNAPLNGILEINNNTPKILSGFGYRFTTLGKENYKRFREGIPNIGGVDSYDFALVNSNIWSGKEFSCIINIYDLEGRLIKSIAPPIEEGLSQKDFKTKHFKNPKSWSKLMEKPKLTRLMSFKKIVISEFSVNFSIPMYIIFDINGNILSNSLKPTSAITFPKFSNSKVLVGCCPMFNSPADYKIYFTKNEFSLLKKAGWNENNYLEENQFLYICKEKF